MIARLFSQCVNTTTGLMKVRTAIAQGFVPTAYGIWYHKSDLEDDIEVVSLETELLRLEEIIKGNDEFMASVNAFYDHDKFVDDSLRVEF